MLKSTWIANKPQVPKSWLLKDLLRMKTQKKTKTLMPNKAMMTMTIAQARMMTNSAENQNKAILNRKTTKAKAKRMVKTNDSPFLCLFACQNF